MKLAVAIVCTVCFAYVQAQGLSELMMMSSLFGRQGSSSGSNPLAGLTGLSSSSSSSGNPLAGLTGTSSGSSSTNPLAALTSGSSSGNPLSALMGGSGMGRMAGGMMLGGAEMSNLMDFYLCGQMRVPVQVCMMMMQQNM